MKRKKIKAFTLIELMIVMAIIAILVGIALPRFRGMQDEGNVSKADGELRALRTAVESYYMHQTPNAYPATTTTICVTYLLTASPQIIDQTLYDPFGATATTEYRHIRSANGLYYVLFSLGPNRAANITGISAAGVVTWNVAAGNPNRDDRLATNGTYTR